MNKKIITIAVSLIIFAAGFLAGMEYKAFQIRSAITNAFSGTSTKTASGTDKTSDTAMKKAKDEGMITIEKATGDEIALATLKLKVNSVEEKQTINSSYGSPKVAKEGTKFVVINMDVTNTTNSQFSLSADFLVVDIQNREYSTYSDTIGSIDNYLNYKELPPSVKETGSLVYEIPNDASSYNLVMAKAGTKELYKIKLK